MYSGARYCLAAQWDVEVWLAPLLNDPFLGKARIVFLSDIRLASCPVPGAWT